MIQTSNTVSENKIAVWAITPNGAALAVQLAAAFPNAAVFGSARLERLPESAVRFGSLKEAVAVHYRRYGGHVFIMATGIVVRTLAGLLVHKTEDTAVVVVDHRGTFAVSLISGHIGGANRLAEQVAAVIGAQPVVTTATDVNGCRPWPVPPTAASFPSSRSTSSNSPSSWSTTANAYPSHYSVVLVSEGATMKDEAMSFEGEEADQYGHKKLRGIGDGLRATQGALR